MRRAPDVFRALERRVVSGTPACRITCGGYWAWAFSLIRTTFCDSAPTACPVGARHLHYAAIVVPRADGSARMTSFSIVQLNRPRQVGSRTLNSSAVKELAPLLGVVVHKRDDIAMRSRKVLQLAGDELARRAGTHRNCVDSCAGCS